MVKVMKIKVKKDIPNTISKEYLRKKIRKLSQTIQDCNTKGDLEAAFYHETIRDVLWDLLNKKGLFKDA